MTQVQNFVDFAHEKFGRIDFAVNDAGIGGYIVRTDKLEENMLFSDHDPILNNLYGCINLLKVETAYFMKYGNPNSTYSIINLSSLNGKRACPTCSLYSASKHGIIGLT